MAGDLRQAATTWPRPRNRSSAAILQVASAIVDKMLMIDDATTPPTDMTEADLRERLAEHERVIAQTLAPYDPVSATLAWFDTLRAIEECINLVHVDWTDGDERQLFGLPVLNVLSQRDHLASVRFMFDERFGENFAYRFVQLVVKGASIALAFADHGVTDFLPGFASVGSLVGYLMSRRRHFVAMLHALPLLCRGTQRVEPLDTLNLFLPAIRAARTLPRRCRERSSCPCGAGPAWT